MQDIGTQFHIRLNEGDVGRYVFLPGDPGRCEDIAKQIENAKAEVEKPFPDEHILEEKSRRLDVLNAELNMDKRENELVDGAEEVENEDKDLNVPTRDDDRDER